MLTISEMKEQRRQSFVAHLIAVGLVLAVIVLVYFS